MLNPGFCLILNPLLWRKWSSINDQTNWHEKYGATRFDCTKQYGHIDFGDRCWRRNDLVTTLTQVFEMLVTHFTLRTNIQLMPPISKFRHPHSKLVKNIKSPIFNCHQHLCGQQYLRMLNFKVHKFRWRNTCCEGLFYYTPDSINNSR